jgi:hypothetical protein
MKKQLDTRVMENELRGGSAFFRAVPSSQNQPQKEQASPLPAERKDGDPNTATPPLSSPLDELPAIKPPKKEANPAPVVALEQTQTDQPTTSLPLTETPQQMGGTLAGQTDSQPDNPGTLPSLSPTLPLSEETKERLNERSNERTDEPSHVKRQRIRHTFDIYADQLLSLKEIQLDRARGLEKVYRLGDLVQEALDGFITKERNKE